MSEPNNYKQALGTLVTVFFFWGFIAASNGVFIPFCKTYFEIDQFQSQLVDFAFYGAYYFGALLLLILSNSSGKDIMNKWGYKKRYYLWVTSKFSRCDCYVPSSPWCKSWRF